VNALDGRIGRHVDGEASIVEDLCGKAKVCQTRRITMAEPAGFGLRRQAGFQSVEGLAHPVSEPRGLLRLVGAKGLAQIL
jgi:hypothetical protein